MDLHYLDFLTKDVSEECLIDDRCCVCQKKVNGASLEICSECEEPICRDCLRPCVVCETPLCQSCTYSCKSCQEPVCPDCVVIASEDGEPSMVLCEECQEELHGGHDETDGGRQDNND